MQKCHNPYKMATRIGGHAVHILSFRIFYNSYWNVTEIDLPDYKKWVSQIKLITAHPTSDLEPSDSRGIRKTIHPVRNDK
jgi:hypothetical protein